MSAVPAEHEKSNITSGSGRGSKDENTKDAIDPVITRIASLQPLDILHNAFRTILLTLVNIADPDQPSLIGRLIGTCNVYIKCRTELDF